MIGANAHDIACIQDTGAVYAEAYDYLSRPSVLYSQHISRNVRPLVSLRDSGFTHAYGACLDGEVDAAFGIPMELHR